ncbi:LOW QUALITY PROTEIN: doublecortin domain-containing protein 2C [Tautogolabrus adspersus]
MKHSQQWDSPTQWIKTKLHCNTGNLKKGGCGAALGTIRRLYTPREGHKVDDLKHGSVYAAARNEQFKTLDGFIIGDVLAPPVGIRIPKYTLRSWENVLSMVKEKVRLHTCCVTGNPLLCTLHGRPVSDPTELQNNQYYSEKFKALPYERHIPFAHTGFREDLEHTARGCVEKKDTAKPERTKQQRQVSRNLVLFSAGEGSVFNAQNKRSEMERADGVPEDSQLKVDLTIDLVEAKTVEEEEEEEEEEESCCASPCTASLHDSDGSCLQRSLSAGSRNDKLIYVFQEPKERELCPVLRTLRSRMSRFFKVFVPHHSR